jgi:PKD repeat protein
MNSRFNRTTTSKLLLLFSVLITVPLVHGRELRMPPGFIGPQSIKAVGALVKVDGALYKLDAEFARHQQTTPGTPFRARNRSLRIVQGRVLVDARAATTASSLLTDMTRLGLQRSSQFSDVVSGWLPIGAIRQAAELTSLRALSASIPMTNSGSVTSQGDIAQRSYIARSVNGLSGAGSKVGVLSDSFDQQGGAAAGVASGDLSAVQVLDDGAICGDMVFQEPCTDEGRGMLEIVHDVAPGAELAFATAFGGFAVFANDIIALANAGANVIVDDVIYLGEPMFMDGVIAQAVDQVKGMGVSYFSSAGNQARASYEHAYANSGEQLMIDLGGILYPAGYMHDFDSGPGVDTAQAHTIPAGQCAIFSVQWDSPFGSAAAGTGTQNDLDVWLVDDSEQWIVAYDAHENIPTGEPVELMQFCNDGLYVPTDPPVFKLIIALWEGAEPGTVKTVLFGNAMIDEHATNSSTLYGHANANGAEAVGAVYYQQTPEFGTTPPQLEPYSSAGGTPILFTSSSVRLSVPELRLKPEISAPDGVNTSFFYPTSDRDNDGTPDFSGTSAAAPHAAGVAALLLERSPGATPDAIYVTLESTAFDMMTAGFDHDSGYGLIQADLAVDAIAGTNAAPNAAYSWSATDLVVGFTDESSDSDGSIVSWDWNFGDGNSSTDQNPSHSYAGAGDYTVTLTVTDDQDASDTTSQQVTVSEPAANTPPVPSFSYSCNKQVCSFDASSSTDDGAIVSYSWDFGDGDSGTGSTVENSYTNPGSYTVALELTDDGDAMSSVSADVQVKDKGKTSGSVGGSGGGGDTGDSGGGSSCPPAKAAKGKC